jgi:hypothetical protein
MGSQTIHHGVKWNRKHITTITRITASGEYVIPYIITSQELQDLRKVLRQKRIKFERYLILKKSQKPCANSKSFAKNDKSTVIPHVVRIRAEREIE